MRRSSVASILGILVLVLGCGQTALSTAEQSVDTPVSIPLSVAENPHYGTFSASIDVALGDGKALPFGFDTGSSGLHVFADARLDRTPGVRCSETPTRVIYGNPARIVFSGVVCYARLRFAGLTTSDEVPVAYLTTASCPATNPACRIPDLDSPRAMHGYGVFGAGLTGVMSGNGSIPNPILTLPGRRGSIYTIVLSRKSGSLILGGGEPPGSAEFHLTAGTRPGERYSLAKACLLVDGRAVDECLLISFDTGNGVPWIHSIDTGRIPQRDGDVKPGTRIGFAPPGVAGEATFVIAGTTFADTIKIVPIAGKPPITNSSIQAFFGRAFTYDNARGVIAVARPEWQR